MTQQSDTQNRIQDVLQRRIDREEARLADLVQAINQSLSEGDISENSALESLRGEADQVRVEIERMQARLDDLPTRLPTRLTGNIGAVFRLRHQPSGAVLERQLLLSEEQEARTDVITDTSPVGQHLLRARVGTVFSVEVKASRRMIRHTFEVLALEREAEGSPEPQTGVA